MKNREQCMNINKACITLFLLFNLSASQKMLWDPLVTGMKPYDDGSTKTIRLEPEEPTLFETTQASLMEEPQDISHSPSPASDQAAIQPAAAIATKPFTNPVVILTHQSSTNDQIVEYIKDNNIENKKALLEFIDEERKAIEKTRQLFMKPQPYKKNSGWQPFKAAIMEEDPAILVQFFFILMTMNAIVDYALQPLNYSIKDSRILYQSKPPAADLLDYLVFQLKLRASFSQYQTQKNLQAILHLIHPATLGTMRQIYDSIDRVPVQTVGHGLTLRLLESHYKYALYDLYDAARYIVSSQNSPLYHFLYTELQRLMIFYTIWNDYCFNTRVIDSPITDSELFNINAELKKAHLQYITSNECICFFNKATRKMAVSEEFKRTFFELYTVATHNNSVPVNVILHDFWAGEFTITVSPTIYGIIEGYVPSAYGFLGRAEGTAKKPAQREENLDDLVKFIEGKDKSSSEKKGSATKKQSNSAQPSSSSKSKDKKKEKQQSSTSSIGAGEAAAAAQPDDTQPTVAPFSFYTCNTHLSNKQIELDSRILNWYKTTPNGANRGITTQGYLDKGTDRNAIFAREITQCDGNRDQAIANIIFRHQLPYSLIRSIVSYGTIQEGSTHERTTVTILVSYAQGANRPIYYQAEITGRIEGPTFKIWHSFLRPITDISEYLQSNLLSMDHLELEVSAEDLEADTDQRFIVLGEQHDWLTDDQFNQVIISKDDVRYTIFKN